MPNPTQALQVISKAAYFSGLKETLQLKIAGLARRQAYDAGETIFWEGDDSLGLYIVETGWLKVVKSSPGGREQVLNFLQPGEVFNALSVFTGTSNPATVIALEPTIVWLVDQEVMLSLLDDHPPLARAVIEDLAGRLLHMVALVEDVSLRTVEARLARLLLEQAGDETIDRKPWATQAEMAARLGTVPDTLNRALGKLTEQGLIEVARHQIRILDAAGLEDKANSS
ncbi:MAG: Crp/Fnr family transcriptional regulator [Chloroflexi bacterium]|nr:MAG: Crp/Fnr family transcriptional regulator [Chloroflexota bacterium]MBL1197282.1 Crp/Fnr family transcriptional regulator [Chloroflexota bacterium]NOH14577.1 Crp/Fnr family transcriptional regulator [Chloroflexota bacterium]